MTYSVAIWSYCTISESIVTLMWKSITLGVRPSEERGGATGSASLQQRVAAAGNTALVDGAALLDLVTEAIARASNHERPTEWDREAARVAVRRWQSFGRRHKTDNYEARIHDRARGLLERLDPERMDDPGWHVWTAEAAGEVLRGAPPVTRCRFRFEGPAVPRMRPGSFLCLQAAAPCTRTGPSQPPPLVAQRDCPLARAGSVPGTCVGYRATVRWVVQNNIGAAGLPVEAWASAAQARLNTDPAVSCAEIGASRDELGVDGVETADLSVNVTLESADSASAAALVEQQVMRALWDVVGDQEVGWMAGPWVAALAESD